MAVRNKTSYGSMEKNQNMIVFKARYASMGRKLAMTLWKES